jgi:hypothetical protein
MLSPCQKLVIFKKVMSDSTPHPLWFWENQKTRVWTGVPAYSQI